MDSRSQHDAAPTLGSPFEGELSRRPCATEGVSFQMYSVGLMGSFPFDYAQGQDERRGARAPVLIPSETSGSRKPTDFV